MRTLLFNGRHGRKAGFLGMALLVVAGVAVMGALVMLLWNWLMPTLFPGAGQIDYWRAVGLLLLCKLLLGGGRGHWHARRRHWESMTPQERAQIKERCKSRWGGRFGAERWGCVPARPADPAPGHEAEGGAIDPQRPPRENP